MTIKWKIEVSSIDSHSHSQETNLSNTAGIMSLLCVPIDRERTIYRLLRQVCQLCSFVGACELIESIVLWLPSFPTLTSSLGKLIN